MHVNVNGCRCVGVDTWVCTRGTRGDAGCLLLHLMRVHPLFEAFAVWIIVVCYQQSRFGWQHGRCCAFNDLLACCLVNGSMMTAAGQSSFQEAPYRIWLHRHEVVNTRARATQRPLYIIVVIVIVIVIVTSSVGVKFCCVGQLPAAKAARQQASLKRISSLATWWV